MKGIRERNTASVLETGKPLSGMRILICGKGGSGGSSLVTLMSRVLRDKGYNVVVLDGDACNPPMCHTKMVGNELPFFGRIVVV